MRIAYYLTLFSVTFALLWFFLIPYAQGVLGLTPPYVDNPGYGFARMGEFFFALMVIVPLGILNGVLYVIHCVRRGPRLPLHQHIFSIFFLLLCVLAFFQTMYFFIVRAVS